MMASNWSWYNEQLREVDDNLYSQKEQFKMGLMSTATKIKMKEEETEAAREEEMSEACKEDATEPADEEFPLSEEV